MGRNKNKNKRLTNARQEARGTDNKTLTSVKEMAVTRQRAPFAYFSRGMNFQGLPLYYTGEKSLGELGPVTELFMNYDALGARGHHAYATNEMAQIMVNRTADWVIGNGLQVESEPETKVLKAHGINIDATEFSNSIEAIFSLIQESTESSYSRMTNLNKLQRTAFVNGCNGGSLLVVIRVRNTIINYELIDGAHIRSPFGGTDVSPLVLDNGNRMINGIELTNSNEHVRYWVQQADLTFRAIEARNHITGMVTAFLYGGVEGRIDDSRAKPALAGLLQTLAQMDAYKGETLSSAKEQNKVAYQTTYDVKAEGESIFGVKDIMNATDLDGNDGTIPVDVQMQQVADKVYASTGNKAISVPPGGRIEAIGKNEAELYFEAFWNVLARVSCAAFGIPVSVAMMQYNASFAAARAEIKDFAHTMILKRYIHKVLVQIGYEIQLHIEILKGTVKAPGYLKAFQENNILVLEAYRKTRWIGDSIFEIDEMKEVEAIRAKLGPLGAHLPLITQKQGVESLGGGDVNKINENFSNEIKTGEALGIKPIPVPAPAGNAK